MQHADIGIRVAYILQMMLRMCVIILYFVGTICMTLSYICTYNSEAADHLCIRVVWWVS